MAGRWFKGTVKAVSSGDTLLIMGTSKKESDLPPEKAITLASLMAPKLARRDGVDEPFAWDSREYLRKKCIGKEVTFRVEYTVPTLVNREFGSVFMGDVNLALAVAAEGWARVRSGTDKSPYFDELVKAEEQAKQQGLGIWNTKATELSIRSIPPSAVGEGSTFDARQFVEAKKGELFQAIVEQVRDGSSFRVYLLPSFLFVQVHLAGVQAPSMSRRAPAASVTDGPENGEAKQENGGVPDPWAKEAKHFTETRLLHREVRISLAGADKFHTLFGSVFYVEEEPKNLALELVKQGLAKYTEWSANMLEEDDKKQLKAADVQAKKSKLRIYTGFDITSNTKPLKDDTFTGKVIDIMNADCLIIADDAVPPGKPGAERRVSLSSIQAPRRTGNDDGRFREAKEFLRTRIIGQQVHVFMEYSRKVQQQSDGESRVIDFGSVFLTNAPKGEVFAPPLPGQPEGYNVAEMVVAHEFAQVVKHRDFDDRSHYYDNLLVAEKAAGSKGKKTSSTGRGTHINDLTSSEAGLKRAKQTVNFLQRRRLPAVVEVVFSGHRYKLFVPKETCVLFFTLSGVRCPGRGEPYSDEALAFMRRRILQRDVEIEVETLDRTGSFLGSLYEGKVNVSIALLEAGLARLQPGFADRLPDSQALTRAEEHAKKQRLKIWENYQESVADSSKPSSDTSSKQEVMEVLVTEVLDAGRFYVQSASDTRVAAIQKQLEALNLKEKLPPVNFEPKRGDSVLALFSMDNSWYRALIVDTPKQGKDGYEVFYIDYGNQEIVPLSKLRPADGPHNQGLAQLCSLAYIKVPTIEEDCGEEAAEFLSNIVANKKMMARVEARDASGGKVRDQGSGPCLIVTLTDGDTSTSINASMLKEGLARVEKSKKWDSKEKVAALEALAEYQDEARKSRAKMWQYGDIDDEEEDSFPRGGGRGRK